MVKTYTTNAGNVGLIPGQGTKVSNAPASNQNFLKMPLVVQWLRFHASRSGGIGLIPGEGTKIS